MRRKRHAPSTEMPPPPSLPPRAPTGDCGAHRSADRAPASQSPRPPAGNRLASATRHTALPEGEEHTQAPASAPAPPPSPQGTSSEFFPGSQPAPAATARADRTALREQATTDAPPSPGRSIESSARKCKPNSRHREETALLPARDDP